ncbi:hypothetical protein HW452_05200 [Halomonas aquamarina]|uniref:Uncharacterized protein n=1 Tax=Vreelandella aquamarina TaxID=77097 RepID=A0ACC5VRK8_9GAMM|nr:hypothetical protein [Halomonas aquamarina]MBZ5486918.1 hypothetical protein [Halomonas aquamarina]
MMISNVWAKIVGFLSLVAALLGAALLFVAGQRDRAREAANLAKAEARSKSAVLDAERAIDKARAEAREHSQEVQREADKRPAAERPTGSFRR